MRNAIKNTPVIGWLAKETSKKYHSATNFASELLFYLRNKKSLEKNIELKDKYKDKRCFILGCGPSVNGQDLSKLAGEFCISVSNFFVHKDFKRIKPAYHVFAQSHEPITEEDMVVWLKDAEKHMPSGQEIVMSAVDKDIVDKNALLEDQGVYYYIADQRSGRGIKRIDFTKKTPFVKTIVHQAIYLALYSGAKEIYLLGCDHSWIMHPGQGQHFYNENQNILAKTIEREKRNLRGAEMNMEGQFLSYLLLWETYKKIRNLAQKHDVKIWNATPGSLLDIFPKVDLEEILSKKL